MVGAGCAGLSAALEAADQGATVAVLEKMGMPFGNTIYAGGIFNATNTYVQKEQGLTDTVDAFYEDMMKVSAIRSSPAYMPMKALAPCSGFMIVSASTSRRL